MGSIESKVRAALNEHLGRREPSEEFVDRLRTIIRQTSVQHQDSAAGESGSTENVPRVAQRRWRVGAIAAATAVLLAAAILIPQMVRDQGEQTGGEQPTDEVRPTTFESVKCFATASLTDLNNSEELALVSRDGAPSTSVQDYVELCAQLWEYGELHADPPYVTPNAEKQKTATAPELTPCLLPDGKLGIFPGPRNVCQRLNLRAAATD